MTLACKNLDKLMTIPDLQHTYCLSFHGRIVTAWRLLSIQAFPQLLWVGMTHNKFLEARLRSAAVQQDYLPRSWPYKWLRKHKQTQCQLQAQDQL
jgi:hypothetical protein